MARGYPDHEGDKSGLFSKPSWAAYEGKDKNLYSAMLNRAWGQTTVLNYTVPAGSTLYITDVSFSIKATAAADADNNQIGYCYLWDVTSALVIVTIGGNGGGSQQLSKPAVIPSGHAFQTVLRNDSNHKCDLHQTILGFEV